MHPVGGANYNSDNVLIPDYNWIFNLGTEKSTEIHLSLYSLGNAGVTCFMFISGYYGVRLNLKKLINLVVMMLFYIVIIRFIAGVNIYKIIGSSLHPWDGWWFVRCYFFICILSPLINLGISYISQRQFRVIVVLLLFYTYLGHFLALKSEMNSELLITIFLVARYFKLYPPAKLTKFSGHIVVISTLLIVVTPIVLSNMYSTSLMTLFLNNNNIILLLFAASVVSVMEQHPLHFGIVNWLSASTLSIYLITDNELRGYLDPWLLERVLDSPVYGYTLIILLCLLCLLFEKIRLQAFKPLTRRLDNFIDNHVWND